MQRSGKTPPIRAFVAAQAAMDSNTAAPSATTARSSLLALIFARPFAFDDIIAKSMSRFLHNQLKNVHKSLKSGDESAEKRGERIRTMHGHAFAIENGIEG